VLRAIEIGANQNLKQTLGNEVLAAAIKSANIAEKDFALGIGAKLKAKPVSRKTLISVVPEISESNPAPQVPRPFVRIYDQTPDALLLHVGAHKTGTSHLQSVLVSNRAAIAAHGITFLDTGSFRRKLGFPLLRGGAQVAQQAADLSPTVFSSGKALISDENILGRHDRWSDDGTYYPHLEANIGKLRALWPGQVRLLFCVRDYADWVESCYLQMIKMHKVIRFDKYLKQVDLNLLSWPRMLERLLNATDGMSITVWSYEHYRKDNDAIISYLSQELGFPLVVKPASLKTVNSSLSEAALKVLMAAHRHLNHKPGKGELVKLQAYLRKNLLARPGLKKPMLMPSAIRVSLRERYERDCAKISRMAPERIHCLGFS
jgi:hypothetical protein